jgi:exonuclease III
MADKWRFGTWNLDWWGRNRAVVPPEELLEKVNADILALQEVPGSVAKRLTQWWLGEAIFSQALHAEASWRWMGCGLLLRPGIDMLEKGVVATLPKPQRSVWARVVLPGTGHLTVVSWHTPNRAGDGLQVKMAAYAAMAEWLSAAQRPIVVGADLNTWYDPVDLDIPDSADDYYEEHAFLGADPMHGLVDAYRTVLEVDGELARLRNLELLCWRHHRQRHGDPERRPINIATDRAA